MGQYVRCGELLVSGVADSTPLGFRYIRARGAVWARTVREIHIEIPMEYEQKSYTGEVGGETRLIFFGKNIKVYKNTGFLGSTYDTICNVGRCCLFGTERLPLWLERTQYRVYSLEPCRRTDEQAMELAYAELDARLAALTADGATFLRKDIVCQPGEQVFTLDCTLALIENIAGTVEFEVSEQTEEQ